MADFKTKRIEYINNWPNIKRFEAELQYEEKFRSINNGTPFIPFKMVVDNNEFYNKAVSFLIDAVESLGHKPNHSFEFIFTAYDIYSKSVYSINRITNRNWRLTPDLCTLIESDTNLKNAFSNLISHIPQKSLQYLFVGIHKSQILDRSTKNSLGAEDSNRLALLNKVNSNYPNDFANYANAIRPGSRLLYRILTDSSVSIDSLTYHISFEDQLHILLSGYIYSLRNDTAHGSVISITKSSMTNMATMANSYFAFLLTYYLFLLLTIDHISNNKSQDLANLAQNITLNLNNYINLFGHALSK